MVPVWSISSTGTVNQRSVARLRKIILENGENYVDLMSEGVAAGAGSGASSAGTNYSGNMLAEAINNRVGVRKAATANALPAGFSFYILGR